MSASPAAPTSTAASSAPSASPTSPAASPETRAPALSDKSLEMRFGLVMYGGVSLAIYINGVSHEFFRAVHGNGVYRLLKQLTDVDINVDIISGSSAGGINGIFLSYALANGKDFGAMASLWRDLGDVRDLLWPVETPAAQCDSLFNSDGYYQDRLQRALAGLPDYEPAAHDDPTLLDELDLFVTGTDVGGNVYTTVDEDGHMIDVKDHRRVFQLKHRANRPNPGPFVPGHQTHQALARLARITSSFPGAFSPVCVPGKGDPTSTAIDESLRIWGGFTKRTHFVDGGVLDNKPFTPTFRAICTRPIDRPAHRQLCYVEPDPDCFPEAPVAEPSFLSTVVGGAAGIKGYESIAEDLHLIASHNAKVERYLHVCERLLRLLPVWLYDEVGRNGVVLPEESTLFALNARDAGGRF